jgi:hypothetical protein
MKIKSRKFVGNDRGPDAVSVVGMVGMRQNQVMVDIQSPENGCWFLCNIKFKTIRYSRARYYTTWGRYRSHRERYIHRTRQILTDGEEFYSLSPKLGKTNLATPARTLASSLGPVSQGDIKKCIASYVVKVNANIPNASATCFIGCQGTPY